MFSNSTAVSKAEDGTTDGVKAVSVISTGTVEMELKPPSSLSRLLAPLAASRIKAAVAANLNQLKLVLDGDVLPR